MSFVSSNAKFTNGQWLYSSFNGETFKTEASTKFLHQNVMALGSYRNSPFVTGHGSSTNGFKTEILNYKSGNWEEGTEYPFSNGNRYVSDNFLECKNLHELMIMKNIWSFLRISNYATASTRESVLIIGGFTDGSPSYTSTIAEYKDGSWKNVGDLTQSRSSHGAITSGSVTMVIGGNPNSGFTS